MRAPSIIPHWTQINTDLKYIWFILFRYSYRLFDYIIFNSRINPEFSQWVNLRTKITEICTCFLLHENCLNVTVICQRDCTCSRKRRLPQNIGLHNNIILSKRPHAKFIDTTAPVDEWLDYSIFAEHFFVELPRGRTNRRLQFNHLHSPIAHERHVNRKYVPFVAYKIRWIGIQKTRSRRTRADVREQRAFSKCVNRLVDDERWF